MSSSTQRQKNPPSAKIAELRARAAKGDAEAQYELGVLYSDGQGVSAEQALATEWFLKAAANDHAEAQFCLGIMHEHGIGVPKDYVQAVAFYCRAIEHGDIDAVFQLGWMYALGRAVKQDNVEAFAWMHLATCRATGAKDRKRYLQGRRAVGNWLTRAQMAEARKLAGLWAQAIDRRPMT